MNAADIDLIEQACIHRARKDFYAYRQYMSGFTMKTDWFVREISREIQRFYENYKAGERPILVLEAPPQHGKLLADETPVLTVDGWKCHGELKAGDVVFHPSGNPVKVTWTGEKHPATTRVTLSNGERFYCHDQHEWTVYSRNLKRWITIETGDMLKHGPRTNKNRNSLVTGQKGKRGSRYIYQLPLVEPVKGVRKFLPVDPYTLGVWLGDGTQTKPAITYDKKDIDIIETIEKRGYFVKNTHVHKSTGVYTSYFYNLRSALIEAGVFAKKYGVRRKHVPEIYLTAPLKDRLELLAGLIDSDGYGYRKNGRYVFTTSDERLADSVCELISTFGWGFSKVTEQPRTSSSGIVGKKPYYVIGFNPLTEIPCVLERKQCRVTETNRKITIVEIEQNVGNRVGNCIEVDSPDGLYLVGRTLQPTHNSSAVTDGLQWMAGDDPTLRFIYASFSERLGMRANKSIQRALVQEKYKKTFPETVINERHVDTTLDLARNSSLIEFGAGGYFRNTTVQGAVTGETLDIGLIDDPLRGRKDANSLTVRNSTWDWFTDDFFTRFDDLAGLIIVLTRWHVDDPVGRLLDSDMANRVRVVSFQAIAERDEKYRKAGEALFPEHKSLDFLLGRKSVMPASNWSALYQQNPFVQGGEIFREEYWQFWRELPKMKRKVIYADTAQKTKEQNDYSVFQCWGEAWKGGLYLIDQIRGKWEAPELLTRAEAFYNKHRGGDCIVSAIKVEDKSSGTGLIQSLRRKKSIPVQPIPRDTDKVSRAHDTVPLIESSAVYLPEGAPWLSDYLDEFAAFPNGAHDDQIDPTMDAITDFLGGSERDYEALL